MDDKQEGSQYRTLRNTHSDWKWLGFESFDLDESSVAGEKPEL